MAYVVITIITQAIFFNNCYNLSGVSSLKKQTRSQFERLLVKSRVFSYMHLTTVHRSIRFQELSELSRH